MFNEKQLEDMIFEKLQEEDYDFLQDRGLITRLHNYTWYRQFYLESYGIADIVGFQLIKNNGRLYLDIKIIELKAVEFEYKHIGQLKRYSTAMHHLFENLLVNNIIVEVDTEMILICKESEFKNDEAFFMNVCQFESNRIDVFSYKFDLQKGIKFDEKTDCTHKYKATNFNSNKTKGIDIVKQLLKNLADNEVQINQEDLI